ncbi:MAG: endolytic transglycosylase MltG [Bacillota bacterium]
MIKRKVLPLLCLVIVAAAVVCGFVFGSDIASGSLKAESAEVVVEPGDGTLAVAAALRGEGVIGHPKVFSLYARLKGYDEKWQKGTFTVTEDMGYGDLCALLTSPANAAETVLIPEGKQIRQIAKILEEAGICSAAAFLEAANTHSFDYPFLAGIHHENPLEGYLFPDTYFFEKDSDPDEVIRAMLDRFEECLYLPEYIDGAKERGLSFDELIILSSIVESEASTREDRETVAAVFLNRLTNPAYTKLQSCVTVEYAMGIKKSIISYQDTQFDSPYNTYMYPGLPVGPICCPGKDSVEATIHHADNNYYYFQSDQNGHLYFAETFEEHAAIQKEVQADWKGEVIENYNE